MYSKKVEEIAHVCHQANKAYCESILDFSQVSWKEAPEWQRKSAMKGVEYHLENPNSTPADSHESWLKEKKEDGWIYGQFKDPINKVHHCMVPFAELPIAQQKKDKLFLAIVRALD